MASLKEKLFKKRQLRVRNKLRTSSNNKRYRLCVSRTTRNISAQIIDDINEITLISATSLNKEIKSQRNLRIPY